MAPKQNFKEKRFVFASIEYISTKTSFKENSAKEILVKLIKNIEFRWKKCNRNPNVFKTKNSEWLISCLDFNQEESTPSSQKLGRPPKQFEQCGVRGKQIRVKKLINENSLDELSFATQSCLRKAGKRCAAAVIQDVTQASSLKRAYTYRRAYKSSETSTGQPIAYTAEDALSLIINAKLSKCQYLLLTSEAKSRNVMIYPSWNQILEAKRKCYPELESLHITESSAKIKLQNLLDLTTKRICILQEDVSKALPDHVIDNANFTLVCKWGYDGSSGQSNYKQRFSEERHSDSFVFMISLVPLQLHYMTSVGKASNNTVIVWKNPCPSSTRFCRSIKLIFATETLERTKQETQAIEHQIQQLSPTTDSDKVRVHYKLILTMVDGKICNALTNTASSQVCYICKAKPSEMNSLDKVVNMLPVTENYSFGLSSLHSWIRFFECCLHISYRLEVKTWRIRGENKNQVAERKKLIVDKFRHELGLLVDQPKQGYGSTNDGNTARIFFRDPKISSSITGVDEEIINRFGVILRTISSGYEIDLQKFDQYAKQTAKLFIEKYPWFYMPTSVHKVLVHGAEVIKHAILPIDQLSEEAQEAKNKEFKYVREHHTRKKSRVSTNEDLINYFLLSSDPIISNRSFIKSKNYKNQTICSEVISLLKEPNIPEEDSDED